MIKIHNKDVRATLNGVVTRILKRHLRPYKRLRKELDQNQWRRMEGDSNLKELME